MPSMNCAARYGKPSCSPVSRTTTTWRLRDGLGDPRLAPEAAPEGLVSGQVLLDELQRDGGAVRGGRPVDPAHPAHADQRIDLILPEASPDAVVGRQACRLVTQIPSKGQHRSSFGREDAVQKFPRLLEDALQVRSPLKLSA